MLNTKTETAQIETTDPELTEAELDAVIGGAVKVPDDGTSRAAPNWAAPNW